MDSSVSPKDEICFLRVRHHISNAVYCHVYVTREYNQQQPRLLCQETGRVEIRVHKSNTLAEVSTLALHLKMYYACYKLREDVGAMGVATFAFMKMAPKTQAQNKPSGGRKEVLQCYNSSTVYIVMGTLKLTRD